MIYVVGDSHVSFFSGKDEIIPEYPPYFAEKDNFRVFRLGAPIAYNILKDNTMYKAKEKILKILPFLVPKDMVLFCFGEIDCRYHIPKNMLSQNKGYEIIETTARRYVEGIVEFKKMVDPEILFAVWAPIGSTLLGEEKSSRDCPIKVTNTERNIITAHFNNILEKKCKDNDILFFSIFKNTVDSFGKTKDDILMDNIHLSQKARIYMLNLMRDYL